jgi:adenosylhomocysteine nucleosidase
MSEHLKPTRGVGWAFLFALRRESAPFTRGLRRLRSFAEAPCPARLYATRHDRALVLETGIGAARAAAAVRWVLESCSPRLVVAAGFAGALAPSLAVGEVILASEVVEPEDLRWRVALPAELGDLLCGRLLSVPRLVTTPEEKRALARQYGALAVDMESAAVAEMCQERRVPCAVVRAISDAADAGLSPQLVTLLAGGRASPARVIAALLRRPRLVGELWRLARDTRRAARRLAQVLHRLWKCPGERGA